MKITKTTENSSAFSIQHLQRYENCSRVLGLRRAKQCNNNNKCDINPMIHNSHIFACMNKIDTLRVVGWERERERKKECFMLSTFSILVIWSFLIFKNGNSQNFGSLVIKFNSLDSHKAIRNSDGTEYTFLSIKYYDSLINI